MNYCALDDAFQEIGGAPTPGCANDYATRAARKEERKKARRCKGPPATYLDVNGQDSDRQYNAPDIPAMNPSIGLREHAPVTAPQGSMEPFVPQEEQQPELPRRDMSQPTMTDSMAKGKKKKFFGADPDSDVFADYVPEQDNYRLQPDFLTAFEHAGVARAGSANQVPNPSVNMFWKPLTPSGAQTSFVEHLPPPGGKFYNSREGKGDVSMDEVMRKMDKIFARLDDMNSSSPEQITSELMMFISSGVFVLFMMDLLVKKGSTLRF